MYKINICVTHFLFEESEQASLLGTEKGTLMTLILCSALMRTGGFVCASCILGQ